MSTLSRGVMWNIDIRTPELLPGMVIRLRSCSVTDSRSYFCLVGLCLAAAILAQVMIAALCGDEEEIDSDTQAEIRFGMGVKGNSVIALDIGDVFLLVERPDVNIYIAADDTK